MATQNPIGNQEVWFEIDRSQLESPLPYCQYLTNGPLSVLVSAAGAGYVRWHDLAITRWRPDRVTEASGSLFYVRDLESKSFWSVGFQPTRRQPQDYVFRVHPGQVEICRVDDQLVSSMQSVVVPSRDVLIRRFSLTNNATRTRSIELTSYDELVLQNNAEFEAHPAFSRLFVETGYVPHLNAIVARRRPRDAGTRHPTYVTFVTDDGGLSTAEPIQFETDRARFVGRNRSLAAPWAMRSEQLSGTAGPVLDPIASLRTALKIPAGETRRVTFVTCLHWESAGAQQLASEFRDPIAIEQAIGDARRAYREKATTHQLSARALWDSQRLVAAAEFGTPFISSIPNDPSSLSDCNPIDTLKDRQFAWLVAYASELPGDDSVGLLRACDALWTLGHNCHLAIVADTIAGSSRLDVNAAVESTISAVNRPRITVLDKQQLSSGQLNWLVRFARATFDLNGSLDKLEFPIGSFPLAAHEPTVAPSERLSRPDMNQSDERNPNNDADLTKACTQDSDQLRFGNGYGGFSQDGHEYVIRLRPDTPAAGPPLPWINVIANRYGGFMVSEDGAGYSWSRNSRQSRLTPWSNDPVCDPHGEAFYVRDEATGKFWSALPGPVRQHTNYEVRHGLGYTTFQHTVQEIQHDVVQFVVRDAPCKITRLRLKNVGHQSQRLSVFSYCHWVLGDDPINTRRLLHTRWEKDATALFANQVGEHEFSLNHVYLACWADDVETTYTADRDEFVGRLSDTSEPLAVASGNPLRARVGDLSDPCAALKVTLTIEPGEERELVFGLGEASHSDEIVKLGKRYAAPEEVERALGDVQRSWKEFVGRLQIDTPVPAIDVMVNGWLPYQNLSCRIWARSSFYQGGGAFGFRDQLQDAAALVYHDPQLTRQQILLHAEHQFVEGDVLHWWHPGAELGLRTRFSDDLLWLPALTLDYVKTTGDTPIWDEPRHFVRARMLETEEQEAYLKPQRDKESASLYEHCCRAIDRSLTAGKHGLPLMGAGDWNDGMNRVGCAGRGESVWLGFFLFDILTRMLPEIERRDDHVRVARYRDYRRKLRQALNENAWDGEWFVRAFDDDGAPVGSHRCDECRIDALVQAWSVLSGAADEDKARQALESVHQHLTDEEAGIIRLLTPAFDNSDQDPGYIKGYLPGVRENGGQYTHGILWVIRAWARLGQGDRAARLLEMISPVTHTLDHDAVTTYQTEPYVIAADVYGEPPHVGRGGWSWYTGSAGWMLRVAVESVLGFQIEDGKTLILKPCLSSQWKECRLRYLCPASNTEYDIRIHNPHQRQLGIRQAVIDGEPVAVQDETLRAPVVDDGQLHTVRVEM